MMDRQSHYYRQVQLLLQLIPFVAQHDCFALKGGTAINLFVRDFPRLSVDIDLVFLPMMTGSLTDHQGSPQYTSDKYHRTDPSYSGY